LIVLDEASGRVGCRSNDGKASRKRAVMGDTIAKHARIEPWLIVPVPLGNAIQIGGLVGGVLMARRAARQGREGTGWLYGGRLLAYFCEHALSHYAVGRMVGIRCTGYGLHGSTHRRLYPPGIRSIFEHLPFLSARIAPDSRQSATPAAQAAMYLAGPVATVLASILFPVYGLTHRIRGSRGLLIGSSLWMAAMLISEVLHSRGDIRRAWRAIRQGR